MAADDVIRRALRSLALTSLLVGVAACGGGGEASPLAPQAVAPEQAAAPPAVPAPPAPAPAPPSAAEAEPTGAGRLVSAIALPTVAATAIGDAVRAQASRAPAIVPLYDVDNFRVDYATTGTDGREIVASGLVSVPRKAGGASSPVLAYQHATIFRDAQAPSNHATADEIAVVFASLGYIVVAADYIGYGASKGVRHPYLRAAPSAAAVVDLLTAARTWRRRGGVADNGQLFLAGYSEGGYVTVAAHRAMQASASAHLSGVRAVVPGGGPYHVQAALDTLLDRVREENSVLGALINPGLLRYLGSSFRREVRRALTRLLIPDDADVAFDLTVLDHFLADDERAIERDSNVHAWAPAAPVDLFHGRADRTVPYPSAALTFDAMRSRGAPMVSLTDCAAQPPGHLDCVAPYFAFVIERLALHARDL